jgi:hypothetical protein
VKRGVAICAIAFALSGCMTAQEPQTAQNMDASDDAYCRKQADSSVNYDQCRKSIMQQRQAANTVGCTSYENQYPPCMSTWPAGSPNYHGSTSPGNSTDH